MLYLKSNQYDKLISLNYQKLGYPMYKFLHYHNQSKRFSCQSKPMMLQLREIFDFLSEKVHIFFDNFLSRSGPGKSIRLKIIFENYASILDLG